MRLVRVLMVSFGVIYLWFGVLKFFPGISPAEVLAGETIRLLTFDLIGVNTGIKLLALLESAIGLACLFGFFPKITIRLIIAHMICTFTPLFLMPEQIFGPEIFQLTLVGQYILKNLVFVSALLIVYNIVSNRETEPLSDPQFSNERNWIDIKKPYPSTKPLIIVKGELDENKE